MSIVCKDYYTNFIQTQMARLSRPRFGSLQFWPRKRAEKGIPSVNWKPITGEGLLGIIAYKVGMASAIVKDSTEQSMTKGKKIAVPVTILEVPAMKVYSVRFYKNGFVVKDLVVSNDKELKRYLKVAKKVSSLDTDVPKDFDDVRVLLYTLVHQTNIKKTPDMVEIAVSAPNKLEFVKTLVGREITVKDFVKNSLIDVRGLTKGKGLVGAVKLFGITLKSHKSEKGVRRPGSLAPWHPAHVTFHTPHSGQLGMFTRVHYNIRVLSHGMISERNINPPAGFQNYGKINTSYIILKGSVQGPQKRQILLTPSFRASKSAAKKKLEFQELILP